MADSLCSVHRVVFVSSTRADWGLLSPLARVLRDGAPELEVSVVATNMHLLPEYGMTVDEIRHDGFEPLCADMRVEGSDEASRVRALARCTSAMADAFESLRPDIVVLLGDRYEILGVASAAALMNIPIVHIAGGEISEGAVDDSIRHAVTKLSTLHLTATEAYRRRVIQLGEDPSRVINTGAIGVWNALHVARLSRSELEHDLGFSLSSGPVAVVTYHPATLDSGESPAARVRELLAALDEFPELTSVITYPNNDARSEEIIAEIQNYAAARPRVLAVRSLGMRRYLSLLACADLCAGNSSSGIVEVPSFHIPTVDIGMRQRGRIAAESVIHCGDSRKEIAGAIRYALSPEMKRRLPEIANPYYKADTLDLQVRAVRDFAASLPCEPKKFYDI
ncbi:MAG: UDP-N-acetylglucosamine 2-epimerase (hydrolyzing) [Muribaculaceae bacterium]|nr:UDP-N-acetylglucosamine 2-epimerase (hydrolyzing) [Muribaculaceae bacterium]